MKMFFSFSVLVLLFVINNLLHPQTFQYNTLEANSIRSYFWSTGIFNQYPLTSNSPGFEWPKGSNKFAIFSSGINLAAKVNGILREATASYKGEYVLGYCVDSIPHTNTNFKIYKVSRGDNQNTNPDWANWGLMVTYGAPYRDVNNNGIYEPAIDTPGVRNAASTIFMCITDGFTTSHNPGEGFGGGTLPLFVEVHLTAWAYTQPSYADMQFIKCEIINKSLRTWTGSYFGIFSDPDVGDANDDYMCCDTTRRLGIVYNGDDNDYIYGQHPPAVGTMFLKGMTNKNVIPNVNIGMVSYVYMYQGGLNMPPCEWIPNAEPYPAYLVMKGYKKDSSSWLNPTTFPRQKTKCILSGDPETNIGWTELKGRIQNCGGDSGIYIIPDVMDDQRFFMGTGAENLTINPHDTQTVYICQLIARGTSNLNSVTKLKQLADVAQNFYNTGFTIGIQKISSVVPDKFELFQNYPNPFNSMTNVKFQILKPGFASINIYDINGRKIKTIVNEKLNTGEYEVNFDGSDLSSGVYFYNLAVEGVLYSMRKMVLLK